MFGCVLLKYVPCELLVLLFMYCQDVPSFGNAPVKMFHLSAGSNCVIWWSLLVHVRVCSVEVRTLGIACIALYVLSRCSIFRQCTCQDVPCFGREQLCYLVVLVSTCLGVFC